MALGEDEVAAAWDANAATWVAHVRAGYDLYRDLFTLPAFLAFLPDLGGLEVIDLGCGEGHNTRVLARRGARMTGVDLSARMIAAARASEAAAPLGIVYCWSGRPSPEEAALGAVGARSPADLAGRIAAMRPSASPLSTSASPSPAKASSSMQSGIPGVGDPQSGHGAPAQPAR
jgi:SAM-dependent methyltransferase